MSQLRKAAAKVVEKIINGTSLTKALEPALLQFEDSRDRAFLQAVCFGVCRSFTRLDFILSELINKPLPEKETYLYALLLVGLYQLDDMRVPEHAAVAETVAAAQNVKKSWAKGFVNAILRRFLREKDLFAEKIAADEEAAYVHPTWWLAAIKKSKPNQWQAIVAANNAKPPMTLRVNTRQLSRDAYFEKLKTAEIAATLLAHVNTGILLVSPIQAESLPGFAAGEVSVQDGAAQLAATLLDVSKPNMRVLDACAAPGGKLMHLLETMPDHTDVLAVEIDAARMRTVQENLARLHLNANCKVADVAAVPTWWDGTPFDRILLDAPCSASGVIRRHPDIKLLRQPQDIPVLVNTQLALLKALWPLLVANGELLYVTCSVLSVENEEVIRRFLTSEPEAKEVVIEATWGTRMAFGRQILPDETQDGFYYAKLKKVKLI